MTNQPSQPQSSNNVTPLRIADAARLIRHVFVRDLQLDAHIGIYRHEEDEAQPIIVNVDLTVTEDKSELEDSLDNVVCYEQVVKDIRRLVAEGHVKLVETLAERIAEECFKDSRVLAARVRIEKLDAIPEARSVGIEIERLRALNTPAG